VTVVLPPDAEPRLASAVATVRAAGATDLEFGYHQQLTADETIRRWARVTWRDAELCVTERADPIEAVESIVMRVTADETIRWWARVTWRDAELCVTERADPIEAVESIVMRVTDGARCGPCGRPITWGDHDDPAGQQSGYRCGWKAIDGRWTRGCR
jgi:hypothetical protein